MIHQECIACGEQYGLDEIVYFCKQCGDLLEIKYNYDILKAKLEQSDWRSRPLSVWRYKDLMPVYNPSKIVTLYEGGTGLHSCKRLGKHLGVDHLYVKNEGENPTGSFKDRGITVGITKAIELDIKTVICASTGNTSASLAAYAAKAGLQRIVIIPSGKIAHGKLAQAMIYGARIVQILDNFDKALKIAIDLSEKYRELYLLNSVNPYRLEGQKSLAFEICEQIGEIKLDRVIVPVGNAGNISAIWKGFNEFYILGFLEHLPKMIGIQAQGAAPIVQAIKRENGQFVPVPRPETIATAIRIGAPVNWKKALKAIKDSGGTAETVADKEILEAQKMIARYEGLFVEPASASSIAGLKKLVNLGKIDKDEVIVCVVTGHGLKDPDIALKISEKPLEVEPKIESIKQVLGISKPIPTPLNKR